MSRLNRDCDVEDMNYTLQDKGRYAGQPIVSVVFGDRQKETGTVKAVKALMDRYGWTDKVRSQRTPLVFTGKVRDGGGVPHDPARENHAEALTTLTDVLRPRRTWMTTRGVYQPTEAVNDDIDHYTLHLSQQQVKKYREGDRDVWQWYGRQAREARNVDFVIESRTRTIEEIVRDFSRNYQIPDDRIFLYPKGDDVAKVNDRFHKVADVTKRNEWRVSPRMSLLRNSGVEMDE